MLRLKCLWASYMVTEEHLNATEPLTSILVSRQAVTAAPAPRLQAQSVTTAAASQSDPALHLPGLVPEGRY